MSYNNGSGGTLTLPSPNSVHHIDVTAAVRSLRRSLSRSPSKLKLVKAAPQSSSGSISSPNSPYPCRVIQRPMPPASAPQLSHQYSQSTVSAPFRSGVKVSLRSGKPKAASAKPISRTTRVSPKSPIKRVLSNTTDSGNSTLYSSPPTADLLPGQENSIFANFPLVLSPTSRKNCEKRHSYHSMHLDISGASRNTFPRLFDVRTDPIPANSVSPLKRSDALMSVDQANLCSPVAKRRSLHGISGFSTDQPNVFDISSPKPQKFEIHEDQNKECDMGTSRSVFRDDSASPTPSTMPRRSDSLRKSTLQQRQGERSSWGRRQGEKHLAQMGAEASTSFPRNRPRVSLDQFVQPALPRDSPFSSQMPLPNPSLHVLDRPSLAQQPHPLSRSLTTSSSTSSMAEESPTHVPVQFEKPRAHPFAKSLPVGARPVFDDGSRNATTPAYKSAKPFQDAFKSTGLISKVNRYPEKESAFRGSKAVMPDTPCKKPIYPSNTYPPSSGGGKGRHRHSIGSPSSPFAPGHNEHFVLGEPGNKMAGLFKPLQSSRSRKGSIFNFDSDIDPQSFTDVEKPPTPTKSVLFRSLGNSKSVGSAGENPFMKPSPSQVGFRDSCPTPEPMCKSEPKSKQSLSESRPVDQTQVETANTTAVLESDSSSRFPKTVTCVTSRAQLGSHPEPKPLQLHSTATLSSQRRVEFAKTTFVITASPLGSLEKNGNVSPKTPRDSNNLMPPDPSSLSISTHEGIKNAMFGSFPPATPTSRQVDHFGGFANRRLSITPMNGQGPSDVDLTLKSLFGHVELIGKGEFSQVFKVTEIQEEAVVPPEGSPGTPPTPSQARVFAVKKTKFPIFGAKACESSHREVNALRALCGRPHVLQYIDSWEKQYHLYIQTEYCDEGSLADFLGTVGSTGRLDDFRIWKILVEASMGLQSIHEAGFVHLDFKPANILINFEGHLKIGDFGMATRLPAAQGIEAEGDRRYMAPEILQGKYDKPADVFALGLIMFEMASNVWLPDNGPHWLALREGDFAAIPTGPLAGSEADALIRDATGIPIVGDVDVTPAASPLARYEQSLSSTGYPVGDNYQDCPSSFVLSAAHLASDLSIMERSDPRTPPKFMVEPEHPYSLDQIVTKMLAPNPADRPSTQQVLDIDSVRWVTTHRRAGATVFEGNWGTQDDGQIDTDMMDV